MQPDAPPYKLVCPVQFLLCFAAWGGANQCTLFIGVAPPGRTAAQRQWESPPFFLHFLSRIRPIFSKMP